MTMERNGITESTGVTRMDQTRRCGREEMDGAAGTHRQHGFATDGVEVRGSVCVTATEATGGGIGVAHSVWAVARGVMDFAEPSRHLEPELEVWMSTHLSLIQITFLSLI